MRRLTPAVATVLVLISASPASAARWQKEERFAGATSESAGRFSVASNERGDRVALWANDHGAFVARAPAGSPFGRPKRFAHSGLAYEVHVSTDDDGDVLAAWTYDDQSSPPQSWDDIGCCAGLRAAVLDSRNRVRWTTNLNPARRSLSINNSAIESRSNFVLAWTDLGPWPEGGYWLARGSTRRGLSQPRRLQANTAFGLLTLDGDRVSALFNRGDRAHEQVTTGDAELSAPADVSGGIPYTRGFAADERGRQYALDVGTGTLRVATRSPGRAFTTEAITPHGANSGAHLGMAQNGAAIVVWSDAANGVNAAVRRPGGKFGPPFRIAVAAEREPVELYAAINNRGDTLVTWADRSAATTTLKSSIGRWGQPKGAPGTLVRSARSLFFGFQDIDPRGRATVVYAGGAGGTRARSYR